MKSVLSAAIAGAALIAAPATAGPKLSQKNVGQSVAVSYADLNLGTVAGQKALERRINAAAKKVCQWDKHAVGTRILSPDRRACFDKARQSAKKQMASLINTTARGG